MQIWSNNFLVWSMEAKWKINLIITAFVGAPAHHQSNAMKSWWCNISQMWFICTKQKVPYFKSLPLHSVHTSTYLDSSFSRDTEHSHVSATCDCAVLSSSRLCLLSAGCTGLAVRPPSSRWHMHPWLVSRQFYHCTLHIIVVSTIQQLYDDHCND